MSADPAAPVLVTGAAGFLGRHVTTALQSQGVAVTAADRLPCPIPGVPVVQGDLRSPEVREAAFEPRPSAVLHLAASTSVLGTLQTPQDTFENNVAMTQALLELCRQREVKTFVFVSSNAAHGNVGGTLSTQSPLRPLTPYGATKAAAEMLCAAYEQAYGLDVSVLRLTNVYGPGMQSKDNFMMRLFRAAAQHTSIEIYGDGLQDRDFIFVDDVVRTVLAAWRQAWRGPVTVGSGRSVTLLELCRLVSNVTGVSIPLVHRPPRPGEMRSVRVDVGPLHAQVPGTWMALEAGLEQTWRDVMPA